MVVVIDRGGRRLTSADLPDGFPIESDIAATRDDGDSCSEHLVHARRGPLPGAHRAGRRPGQPGDLRPGGVRGRAAPAPGRALRRRRGRRPALGRGRRRAGLPQHAPDGRVAGDAAPLRRRRQPRAAYAADVAEHPGPAARAPAAPGSCSRRRASSTACSPTPAARRHPRGPARRGGHAPLGRPRRGRPRPWSSPRRSTSASANAQERGKELRVTGAPTRGRTRIGVVAAPRGARPRRQRPGPRIDRRVEVDVSTGHGICRVAVADDGPGIDEDVLPRDLRAVRQRARGSMPSGGTTAWGWRWSPTWRPRTAARSRPGGRSDGSGAVLTLSRARWPDGSLSVRL